MCAFEENPRKNIKYEVCKKRYEEEELESIFWGLKVHKRSFLEF
jgi:hypothetical protein